MAKYDVSSYGEAINTLYEARLEQICEQEQSSQKIIDSQKAIQSLNTVLRNINFDLYKEFSNIDIIVRNSIQAQQAEAMYLYEKFYKAGFFDAISLVIGNSKE